MKNALSIQCSCASGKGSVHWAIYITVDVEPGKLSSPFERYNKFIVMTESEDHSDLIHILKKTILPRIERDGMAQIFAAQPSWKLGMELPDGMTATPKPLCGKRVAVRGGRAFGKVTVTEANWPHDNLHSTRTPKLCLVLTGPVAFRVNNYVLHCLPGHGILLPAGTPFSNGRDKEGFLDVTRQHSGIYEMLQMMSYHDGLLCWLSRGQQDAQGKLHKSAFSCMIPRSKVTFYLSQLVEEAIKPDCHQRLVCNGLLSVAIVLLHRELQQLPVLRSGEIQITDSLPVAGHKKYSITKAQEYIGNNLREPLSIDRVARYVCMSRTVFTAQFRTGTGKTFSQYIQDLRFEEASKLLRETDLTIEHICAAVGLKPHRMRVLFHERDNMSPTEFRRHHGSR